VISYYTEMTHAHL